MMTLGGSASRHVKGQHADGPRTEPAKTYPPGLATTMRMAARPSSYLQRRPAAPFDLETLIKISIRAVKVHDIASVEKGDEAVPNRDSANHASAHRVQDDLGRAVQIELLHDPRAMGFDGAETDEEQRCDFLVDLAFGNELKDFALAIR